MPTFSLLYSYPTLDRYYRGQRGIRVKASSEQAAIDKVRRGVAGTGYGPIPDAQIVRCKQVSE
jgi:hypothetical protein